MQNIILVIHLIVALVLIGAILLQRSEGGALGIGGSGGGGGSLFSARGVGNGLTRLTAILAVCFFITSVILTILATRGGSNTSVFDQPAPGGTNQTAPAQPGEPVLPNLGQTAPAQPATPPAPAAPVQ
jgi:preprotein translocase subunit SecG